MDQEIIDQILEDRLADLTSSEILQVPGVREALLAVWGEEIVWEVHERQATFFEGI